MRRSRLVRTRRCKRWAFALDQPAVCKGRVAPLLLALILLVCGGCRPADEAADVRIGTKEFTESVVLAEILAQLATSEDRTAETLVLGGTPVVWKALLAGEIDAYVDYTGTLRQEIFSSQQLPDDDALRAALKQQGVGMSDPLGFNNTYALGVSAQFAAEHPEITMISDLAELDDVQYGFSHEFMDRSDGWPSLSRAYGLPQSNAHGLDHALAYRGVQGGSLDVIDVYTTDAEIKHYNIRVLEDDRQFFTVYDAVVLYRLSLAESHPDLIASLRLLEGRVDAEQMRRLNAAVMLDNRPERVVAADYVEATFNRRADATLETRIARLWRYTLEHAFLVGVSVSLAILIAVPLGIAAAKTRRFGQWILGIVGVIQTIPSLVLFVILIPFLGIGPWPAICALFLYSLLPIVRNTYAGLHDIPGSLQESALVLGLSPAARLRLIELPLAARSILAGIKTAAVINIGTATLGGLINAGGYGDPIFTGIRLDRSDLLLEGAIPAAVMALLVQGAFEIIERWCVSPGLQTDRG